jgi:hypothetical protein
MKNKIVPLLKNLGLFSKQAARTLLGSMILAGITYIFTGNFTFISFSERLFWIGVAIILVGGVVMTSMVSVRRSFGIPMIITKPEHAKALLDHSADINKEKDKRIDLAFVIWLTGLLVIGVSALLQIFAEKLAG